MKIVLTADIHYGNMAPLEGTGPFDKGAHRAFAAEMHALKPDVLVVAGDCAETCINSHLLREFLEAYRNPYGASICVPGNHDVWLDRKWPRSLGHQEKYDWFFRTAKMHGWIALRDAPWSEDGVWIAGSMCWYDFSSADPLYQKGGPYEMSPQAYDGRRGWSDYERMDMGSALEVCKARMAEFDSCLFQVPPRQERKALLVVTHMVGFPRLMNDLGEFGRPDGGRAFMGNYSIGEAVAKAGADCYCCGHTHRRKEFVLGNTRCINNGSGYGLGSKRYDVVDF